MFLRKAFFLRADVMLLSSVVSKQPWPRGMAMAMAAGSVDVQLLGAHGRELQDGP